jgi:hypothetical protein
MFEDGDIRQYDVVRDEAKHYAVWPVGSLVSPGPRSVVWVADLGRLIAVLPLLLSPVRHLREVRAAGITAGASSE